MRIFRYSMQEALQQMRAVDDRIIYKLNTSVPTISFADQVSASDECKHLYEQVRQPQFQKKKIHQATLLIRFWCVLLYVQLQRVYSIRSKAIQACVDETSANVSQLSTARDANTDNRDEVVRQLRKEQTKVCTYSISDI